MQNSGTLASTLKSLLKTIARFTRKVITPSFLSAVEPEAASSLSSQQQDIYICTSNCFSRYVTVYWRSHLLTSRRSLADSTASANHQTTQPACDGHSTVEQPLDASHWPLLCFYYACRGFSWLKSWSHTILIETDGLVRTDWRTGSCANINGYLAKSTCPSNYTNAHVRQSAT